MMQASQKMTTYSLVIQPIVFYRIQTISTPNRRTQLIATTSSSILNLNIPMILPKVGK